jgi:hypothetical protein
LQLDSESALCLDSSSMLQLDSESALCLDTFAQH